MSYQINDKKKALLAYKEEILRDIKYFEQRIEEAHSLKTNSCYYDNDDDDDDSDSDNNFSLDMGPSVTDLKLEQGCLQTCLHATQELTNLSVLQSEVNVMVNDPEYEREPPVTGPGTWREVTADCRVDLVPFSITFYVHQSSLPFGPTSYRGLRVTPVKAAHENELAKSILPCVDTPSNAVEVLRSYAVAHRSRRTTLARLAEKYSNSLFMEPMADGGYVIKCANLLEVIWTLENKWSPVAPFHHKMKFDLEYMDEMYVKIISQVHRELSDPTLETDERTRLMSKIIATCLEAQGPSQELYESMDSDVESENLRKRDITLDEEIKEPVNKKKKDSEIMAPPKSLPKKTKPKGKENNADNKKNTKSVKRSVTDDRDDGAKKTKLAHDNFVNNNKISTIDKDDKENVAMKKKSDDKASNVKDSNDIKMNGDKQVPKVISTEKKSIAKTNKSNKNDDINTKNIDKENVTALKKGSDGKASDVKNNAGSSKLDKVKKTNENTKIFTDKLIDVSESVVSKKNVDKQNLKGKSNNEKDIVATHNSNILGNNKKTNKIAVEIPNQDTARNSNKVNNNKNPKSYKRSENVKEINSEQQNVRSNSANNEKAHAIQVSSSHANIVSENDKLSTFVKVSNKKNNPKVRSTENMKENLANIDNGFNTNNNTNKKNVTKGKSIEKPKNADTMPKTLTNITKDNPKITKNVNNCDESNIKTNAEEKKIKSKSKERLNNDALTTKNSVKSNTTENMAKEDLLKHAKKTVEIKENTKNTKENPTVSAINQKNVKTNNNTEKIVNKRDSALTNIKEVHNNIKANQVVNNMNAKSNNTNKVLERNDNTNKRDKNNIDDLNKHATKQGDKVNKELPVDVNNKMSVVSNDNVGRHFLKQKNSNNDQICVANYNANDNLVKPKVTIKINNQNSLKNFINNKNLRPSKSPIQKSKIKLLNPRNKISIDKIKMINKNKENDLQKGIHDANKISTKIPQKLMSVREQIVKKNPLRISPRKPHSNLNNKTVSQNSSRSSQRSLQKPMTGIPRLMKKPIHKG